MILYHGSNVAIERIDLKKSRPFKDFGRAFYLSADEQQAWERAVAAMTMWGGSPCVTAFEFDETLMSSGKLKVKTFEDIRRSGRISSSPIVTAGIHRGGMIMT